MAQDPLLAVGLRDPGGNPVALHRDAQAWADLAIFLSNHSMRIEALSSPASFEWSGEAADIYARRTVALAEQLAELATSVAEVAAQQQSYAETHTNVRALIIEISVMIGAVLAFYAAAAVFPALLAWANAWLTYLVGTGVRALVLLGRALDVLVRGLVRARSWITSISQLTWRSERFAVGYGRMLVEGVRDFAVDISAYLVASGVSGRPIDPARLFISAGISGLGGSVVGGLEKSGVRKALDDAGQVRRRADGRPEFVTFDRQLKEAIRGSRSRPEAARVLDSRALRTFDEARAATQRAANLGITGHAKEGRRLAESLQLLRADLNRAQNQHRRALDDLARATEDLATHRNVLSERARAWENAETQRRTAEAMLPMYQASGNERWIRESAQEVDAANRAVAAAADDLTQARGLAQHAEQNMSRVQQRVQQADARVAGLRDELDRVTSRSTAWHELHQSRHSVNEHTTAGQQWTYVRRNNPWSASFGTPNRWQDVLFYEMPKEFINGSTSGTIKTSIEVGRGNASPDDIWRNALLQGGTGAARGGVNGSARNHAYPSGGLEETVWKIGSKSADIFSREHIKAAWSTENASTAPDLSESQINDSPPAVENLHADTPPSNAEASGRAGDRPDWSPDDGPRHDDPAIDPTGELRVSDGELRRRRRRSGPGLAAAEFAPVEH